MEHQYIDISRSLLLRTVIKRLGIFIQGHPKKFAVKATCGKYLTLSDIGDHLTLGIHGFIMAIQSGSSWGELKLPQSRFHTNRIPIPKIQIIYRHTFLSVASHNGDWCVHCIGANIVVIGQRFIGGRRLRGGDDLFLLVGG